MKQGGRKAEDHEGTVGQRRGALGDDGGTRATTVTYERWWRHTSGDASDDNDNDNNDGDP